MSEFTVYLKATTGGDKIAVNVRNDMTIGEMKAAVAERADVPAENQRLIYKGQVLKDERTVESYGLAADHVLHLVKSRPAAAASSTTSQGPSPAAASTALPTPGAPMGGFGGDMGLGSLRSSPEMMQQMMNTPIMQSMLSDPELMRNMLSQNPAISQMMERNPEFAQMLNNPQLLRESMQLAANPALMREQMRNADRAFSNIESHPEGFNALRRMYENVQEPLMDAMANDAASGAAGRSGAANPFAALFDPTGSGAVAGTPAASAAPPAGSAEPPVPNTSPLPNPWAPSSAAPAGTVGGAPAAGDLGAGLGAGLGGMGGLGGGLPGLGSPAEFGAALQAMQNPAMQQAMQAMLSNPAMMETMTNAAAAQNPQLRAMLDADPRLRQALSDPETIRRSMDPANLQAMLQMQQAMQQLQASGLMPPNGGAGFPGVGGAPAAPGGAGGQLDFASMLGGLNMAGLGQMPAAHPEVANPEVAFASQLEQLQAMGFFDAQANIRALQATGGNVSAAVDRLLQQM